MNDFTILHLSDLHIANTDGTYSGILLYIPDELPHV